MSASTPGLTSSHDNAQWKDCYFCVSLFKSKEHFLKKPSKRFPFPSPPHWVTCPFLKQAPARMGQAMPDLDQAKLWLCLWEEEKNDSWEPFKQMWTTIQKKKPFLRSRDNGHLHDE